MRQLLCVAVTVVALVAFADLARAQAALECKATETQAECHARLKCRADESLEACRTRLRQGGSRDDRGDRDNRGDRDDRDNRDNRGDRGDRDNRRDRGDRDRNDRGDDRRSDDDDRRGRRGDRGNRNDDDGRSRSRARARRGGGRGERGSRSFEANKTFGLGIELGEPSGLIGKYFLSPAGALDFGVGWVYSHYYYGDGLHVYGDYLWHPVVIASTDSLELPFYIGVGARFWDFEYYDRRDRRQYNGSAFGIRVPLGISLDFNNVPLDIFFQLVPVLDFVSGDYSDRFDNRNHFGVDGSFGLRFWFN